MSSSQATQTTTAADDLASWLNARIGKAPTTVAWLNHHTALHCLGEPNATKALQAADYVGVDGLLLLRLLRGSRRTSADLVIPALLHQTAPGTRVALIGGSPTVAAAAGKRLKATYDHVQIAATMDGYDGLLRAHELREWVRRVSPDIVLIGAGAPLQEELLGEAHVPDRNVCVLTCGGYLDQLLAGGSGYYPACAYRLRLNWAVRLFREPTRLWRRYTVEALQAVRLRHALRDNLAAKPGLDLGQHSLRSL